MQDKSPITKFREIKGFTLEEFGQMISPPVDKSTVLRWERGHVPLGRIPDVIAATGISIDVLRPDLTSLLKGKRRKASVSEDAA